jgi:hypothetical protein
VTSRSDYVQILKLPEGYKADEVYDQLESVKTQPVQVSPLGLKLLSRFQPKNFGSYIDRLLRININSEMTSKNIAEIIDELALIFKQSPKRRRSISLSSRVTN